VIDLSELPEAARRRDADSVPNGIAYDAKQDRLFVTGKNWPRLYEISLKPRAATR
jgi:glutamine cyclotransferase